MYTYPSVTINDMTFTARREGPAPAITYTTGATAGSEVVTLAATLATITIQIEDGVSTNAQIKAAVEAAKDAAVQSLYASDLVSISIAEGEEEAVNSASGPNAMTGAVNVPPPSNPSVPAISGPLSVHPTLTIEGMTYTAVRTLQAPTITYVDGTGDGITAGNETIEVASDLSDITINIEAGVSTNTQIKAAFDAWDGTTNSLYPRDLATLSIAGGQASTTPAAAAAAPMERASRIAIPVLPSWADVDRISVDPTNPVVGQFWYNTSEGYLKFFDGSETYTVASES